jgi:hypothetical protein
LGFFKDRFRKEASDLVKAEAVRALGLIAEEAEAVLKRIRKRK